MKIGLNMQITDTTPHPMEIARKCEAWGFESMFVNEHLLVPVNCKTPYYFGRPGDPIPEYYAHFPEPFIALAMAAAVTKNIKIGTCVSLLAEHETPAARVSARLLPQDSVRRSRPSRGNRCRRRA
ncbi:MAG TPA: LLM class flavin-dependent oxidoreductase [Candidatus Binataceae bacterium]|nr:LLM class flavin-dependent oxidoreductase [Candidatus Binataceae bacterium]